MIQNVRSEKTRISIKEPEQNLNPQKAKHRDFRSTAQKNPNTLNRPFKDSIGFSDLTEQQIHYVSSHFIGGDNQDLSSLQMEVSTSSILPNILIVNPQPKRKKPPRRSSLDSRVIEGRLQIPDDGIIGENYDQDQNTASRKNHSEDDPTQQMNGFEQIKDKRDKLNPFTSPSSKLSKLEQVEGVKLEDEEEGPDDETITQDEESMPDSLFVVENKLNDALILIKKNKLMGLEEFLYDFKTKYSTTNDRVQIKWGLLMAYCKEKRKEYERASILYSQVLEMMEQSPKSLIIDRGEVYHRLGICYMEIRKWNDGIMAFVKALNEFKCRRKVMHYAECINNLGTLYLYADQIEEAEKCFLISYKIKKKNYPQYSNKLISSLLNLFECNIVNRNYQQAEEILKLVQKIIANCPENDMLAGGLLRRQGKLAFLIGNLAKAEDYFERARNLLQEKYPFCLDFGELMNNFALLRLEEGNYEEAKMCFKKGLIILNFIFTKDSLNVQTIKRNLDLLDRISKQTVQPETLWKIHKNNS